ncbi:MAG: hypothetical protein DWQ36_17060 [Acidobacteria bacterium]|nr:MAG: hypothetical protein DWQ30_05155 [Acidobacteriota bacterium]REK04560.1 MAG: hypothetical protein DWQ36_17060 [Acidobacteriota bacterium]
MTPPRGADPDEVAEVRRREREMNQALSSGGPGLVPGTAASPGAPQLRDPWSDLSPARYTCSGDRLEIEAFPGGTLEAGDRGTFQVPPLRFILRRSQRPAPPPVSSAPP